MAKFTAEEREKIVLEYENSNKGAKYFCEKYGLNKPNTLYKWVEKYKLFGINGLQEKRGRKYKIENGIEREQNENDIKALRAKLATERNKNKYLQTQVTLMEKSILSQYKKISKK